MDSRHEYCAMKNKNSPLISDKNEEELPHKGVRSQYIAVVILICLLYIVSTLPDATAPVMSFYRFYSC